LHFEHFAINVPEPEAMARWYVTHFGMTIVERQIDTPYAHFLADDGGRTCVEIYNNPIDPVPDYERQHPLRFHWAFAVEDPDALASTLEANGATVVERLDKPDGSRLLMLRDPWNIPLQLCRRHQPMP